MYRVNLQQSVGIVLFLCAVASVTACRAQSPGARSTPEAERWIGLEIHPYPPGVEFVGGGTLGQADTATYSIHEVKTARGRYLWLIHHLGRNEDGTYRGRITAALPLTDLPDEEWLVYSLCGRVREGTQLPPQPENLVINGEIVAIVRVDDRSVWTNVRRAWRASREQHRFIQIPNEGIACINDIPDPH